MGRGRPAARPGGFGGEPEKPARRRQERGSRQRPQPPIRCVWLARRAATANENWYNAHNFYGELGEIDAATLDDARTFYDTYYVPRNAVLVVAGDFDPAQVKQWIERYFGPLPDRPEPAQPDVSEPRQTVEKHVTRTDPLAPRPGLAFAYHVPPRNTREWYAFGLLDEILLQGEDSRLWRRIVAQKGFGDSISGGINLGGTQFDYDGPMLWTASLLHDASTSDEQIMHEVTA